MNFFGKCLPPQVVLYPKSRGERQDSVPKAGMMPILKVKVCGLIMDAQGRWFAKRAKCRILEGMLREEEKIYGRR